MSLAQPMKQEPEFALREDNIMKEEEFEAHEVLQTEVAELEYEESETQAEPDSKDCSDPVILKDNDELMMDGNQPLCVVSEITTLDHNCVKQSTIDKLAVTDKIFSRRPKATSRLHHTDTKVDKKTKINMTKVVQLVLTSDTIMKTDVDTCRLCQKSTMKKYKYCSSCENVGAYRQLNSLYKRPQLPLMKDDGVFSLKLCEQKSQDAKVMEKRKIKYPIRECWVRLERCDAENTARLHTNAVTQSANSQTDKPYHCETCNGKPDTRQFCQTCKNLNPVSLKTDVLRTRLITKMNLTKVSRNEKDFQRSTGGGKKSYACEICKATIYNNQKFCLACAREVASRQLLTIIK